MTEHVYTSGRDLAELLRLAAGATGIIEFGTARGQTTLALARACPAARVVTLDVDRDLVAPPTLFSAGAYQECDLRPRAEVGAAFHGTPEAGRITQVWVEPSGPHDIAALAALGPFDMSFIDSLHTYDGVKRDAEAAIALVRGIIVFDDVRSAGVPTMLSELSAIHDVIYIPETRLAYLANNR